jgi:hypothetical protein
MPVGADVLGFDVGDDGGFVSAGQGEFVKVVGGVVR